MSIQVCWVENACTKRWEVCVHVMALKKVGRNWEFTSRNVLSCIISAGLHVMVADGSYLHMLWISPSCRQATHPMVLLRSPWHGVSPTSFLLHQAQHFPHPCPHTHLHSLHCSQTPCHQPMHRWGKLVYTKRWRGVCVCAGSKESGTEFILEFTSMNVLLWIISAVLWW